MATDLPSYEQALARASELFGIQSAYWDIWGREHHPGIDIQQAILTALGVDTASAASLAAAVEERRRATECGLLPVCVVAGASDPVIPLCAAPWSDGRLLLTLEDGSTRDLPLNIEREETLDAEGEPRRRAFVRLPADLPFGYHHVAVTLDGAHAEAPLLYCPDSVPRLPEGRRLSGIAISLYGLRSARNWGAGDTTDLEQFALWAHRETGASFIALNPLHAIGNRLPYNSSPYLPNCTFYRNFLYIDVERVPGFAESPVCQAIFAHRAPEIAALRNAEFVEYEPVARLKLRFLKQLYREFRRAGGDARFNAYRAAEGQLLQRYALYCALDETLHKRDKNLWIWPDWPAEFQNPESDSVAAFEREHPRLVEFYAWMAWLVDDQLARVHAAAREAGMAIGLYHDLALATDRCGSDLWAHRDFYVHGCRVGAPPDGFSPKGQDWSFPPPHAMRHRADGFRLFAAAIRNNARHGGALRMDHVMRFFRLYWIPEGREATDGAYVQEHWRDLLRVIALEAHRAGVIVIGEDLGTVEEYVREALAAFGILSYRLLYFERGEGGSFLRPEVYPELAIVSSTTHDLPTLAGFWQGRDIEARREAGLLPDEDSYRAQWSARDHDKQRMLDVMHDLALLPSHYPRDARQLPELTGELHNAVIGFLATTPSQLLVLNQEDLTKETEQQNLPGSTWQYPNWRRKMRFTLEQLEGDEQTRGFAAMYRNWLLRAKRS